MRLEHINVERVWLSHPGLEFGMILVCIVRVGMNQDPKWDEDQRQDIFGGLSTYEQGPRLTVSQEKKAPVW